MLPEIEVKNAKWILAISSSQFSVLPFLKQSVTYAGAKRSTQKTAGIIPTISAT